MKRRKFRIKRYFNILDDERFRIQYKKGPFWIRACFYNPKSDVVHRYYETGSLEKAREILEAIKNGDLEFLENTRVFNKDK